MLDTLKLVGIAVGGGILTVLIWAFVITLINRLLRSKYEVAALQEFSKQFPHETAGGTSKKKEESRIIVLVTYGSGRPPSRAYFSVDPTTCIAEHIVDDEKYRPKNDR